MSVGPASCWAPPSVAVLSQSSPRGRCPLFAAKGPLWWDNRGPAQAVSPRGAAGVPNDQCPLTLSLAVGGSPAASPSSFLPRAGRLPDSNGSTCQSRRRPQQGVAPTFLGTLSYLWGTVTHPAALFQCGGARVHTFSRKGSHRPLSRLARPPGPASLGLPLMALPK